MTGSVLDPLLPLVDGVSDLYATLKHEYVNDFILQATLEASQSKTTSMDRPSGVHQVQKAVEQLNLTNCVRFYQVHSDYYHWPLYKRAFVLNAPSKAHLCKTVLFENVRMEVHGPLGKKDLHAFHPLRSKYYAVIVQYTDKLSSKKLNDFVKKLSECHPSASKDVHLRLAPEEVSFQLTGHPSGGVCPIGMTCPIPIILSEKVLQLSPDVIFMGAGHVDWKLGVPISDFIVTTNCMIADIS